jgi:hypothetical protein
MSAGSALLLREALANAALYLSVTLRAALTPGD